MNTEFYREPHLNRLLLLGLSPLLLVSDSLLKAMTLALFSLGIMLASSLVMPFLRPLLESPADSSFPPRQASHPDFIQFAASLLLLAMLTVIADTLAQIFLYPVHKIMPLFMPLLFAGSLILLHADYPQKTSQHYRNAGVFSVFMLLQAAIRELLIHGAILTDLPLLLPGSEAWPIMGEAYRKLVLLEQPAGALLLAGMLLALLRLVHVRIRGTVQTEQQAEPIPVTRARVTARASQQIGKPGE